MITYQDIYEAAKKERYSENLQPLRKSFVKEVSEYLKEKSRVVEKEDNGFSDIVLKTKKQLENARTLFQELLRRRRKKILHLVLIANETGISKQDFDNMLLFEKSLFEDLMQCVERNDGKLNELLNGKEEGEAKNMLIVFLEDIEEFMASDGEKYGPYETGQFANLPKNIAQIFIGDKVAESMEK